MRRALALFDVWFRYRSSEDWILRGVSLQVPENSITCILGVNGSGKSTLLKVMAGVHIPQRGVVEIFDIRLDRKSMSIVRDLVGLVLQDPDTQLLLPTVREELAISLVMRGLPESYIESKVRDVARRLGIENLLDKSIEELSYGQKKRVAIASVLVSDPRILLLDEPTLGLDPVSSIEVMELIQELARHGKTIVFTTQDIDLAALYADYVIVLRDGKVVAEGTVDEVLREPHIIREKCGLRLTRIGHLFELAKSKAILPEVGKLPLTISEALRVLKEQLSSRLGQGLQ